MRAKSFTAIALSAALVLTPSLTACSSSSPTSTSSDSAQTQSTEATKPVELTSNDTTKVKAEIPESWTTKTSGSNLVFVTPSDFDGIIEIGVDIHPMSAFKSDTEILAYWKEQISYISSEWSKISDDSSVAPVYEATLQMEGKKNSKGYIRVAISGDTSVGVEALASAADYDKAEAELRKVVDSFTVENPEKPNYSTSTTTTNSTTSNNSSSGSSSSATTSQKKALSRAKSYLKSNNFSYSGLIDQLEYEGFTSEQAEHGADSQDL